MILRGSCTLFALVAILFTQSSNLLGQNLKYGSPTFPNALYNYAVDPEGKAWTISFFNLLAKVNDGKTTEGTPGIPLRSEPTDPIVTRSFSIVVPVANGSPTKVAFHLQGLVHTNEGGQATLVVVVNGQSTVFTFPKKTDEGFLRTVEFSADSAAEIRLTVFLIAERDIQFRGAEATLSLSTIDTDALVAEKRAAGKKR